MLLPASPGISTSLPAMGLAFTSALAWAPGSLLLERGYSCIYCQPWLPFGLPWIYITALSPATPDWTPGNLKMDPRSGSAAYLVCAASRPCYHHSLWILQGCALTVQSNASAEVILGSQLIIPHGADQVFSGNLHCMDNTYVKISDVIMP